MTKRTLLFAVAIIVSHGGTAYGQLNVISTGTNFTIDFDSTAGGVNSGQYSGNGFKPVPGPGELDSDGLTGTGMSDGSVTFGGTNTSGDFARGASTGGVYTGGFYAFDVQTGDRALGIQPGGSDFTPGDLILLAENNTGSTIISVDLSYEIWEYNDQDRANSFNFSYSTDNVSYTAVPALDFTSTGVAAGSPAWVVHNRSTVVNVSLNNGDTLYLRWTSDDVSGSGSRDEFGLDDIVVNFSAVNNPASTGLPYGEGFSNCGGTSWSGYSVSGSAAWNCQPGGYYEITASGQGINEDWLISQYPYDFSTDNNEHILIYTQQQYGGPDIELFYSNDYTGSGNPTVANWNALNFTPWDNSDGSGWSASDGDTVSASSIPDTAYLAFKFYGTGSVGSTEDWRVDSIYIFDAPSVNYTYNGVWSPADPSGVTTAFDSIVVEAGGATLLSATTAGQVVVKPGATFDLQGNTLAVNGMAHLMADATGYAQVKGNLSGMANWESHLTAASSFRWFNIAIPTTALLSDISLTNGGFLQADGNSSHTNIWSYYAAGQDTSSDNQGVWVPESDLTGNAQNTGFSIFLGSPYFGSLPLTLSAEGQVTNGTQNITIADNNGGTAEGWNFVPNPYAATIDWDEVAIDNTGITTTYWILRDDGTGNATGQWYAYNSSASGSLPTGADVIAGPFIAPGQAFFIQSGVATSLVFEEDQIDLSQSPAKKSSDMTNAFSLVVTDDSTQAKDFTWVGFESGANDQNDWRKDARKKFNDHNEFPALYTYTANQAFIYNFLNNTFDSRTIPLYFEYGQEGFLTMEAFTADFNRDWSLILEDKLAGTMTDLKSSSYHFSNSSGNQPDRFILHVNQVTVSAEELPLSGIYSYMSGSFLVTHFGGDLQDEELNVSIFNLGGKRVLSGKVKGEGSHKADLSGCARGLYLVKVTHKGEVVYTQKIVY